MARKQSGSYIILSGDRTTYTRLLTTIVRSVHSNEIPCITKRKYTPSLGNSGTVITLAFDQGYDDPEVSAA